MTSAHVAQIDTTAAVYAQLSEDPPVTRSQPPVAGAIRWSRALFGRCKRTMKRAQGLDASVLATDLGRAVSDYLRLSWVHDSPHVCGANTVLLHMHRQQELVHHVISTALHERLNHPGFPVSRRSAPLIEYACSD